MVLELLVNGSQGFRKLHKVTRAFSERVISVPEQELDGLVDFLSSFDKLSTLPAGQVSQLVAWYLVERFLTQSKIDARPYLRAEPFEKLPLLYSFENKGRTIQVEDVTTRQTITTIQGLYELNHAGEKEVLMLEFFMNPKNLQLGNAWYEKRKAITRIFNAPTTVGWCFTEDAFDFALADRYMRVAVGRPDKYVFIVPYRLRKISDFADHASKCAVELQTTTKSVRKHVPATKEDYSLFLQTHADTLSKAQAQPDRLLEVSSPELTRRCDRFRALFQGIEDAGQVINNMFTNIARYHDELIDIVLRDPDPVKLRDIKAGELEALFLDRRNYEYQTGKQMQYCLRPMQDFTDKEKFLTFINIFSAMPRAKTTSLSDLKTPFRGLIYPRRYYRLIGQHLIHKASELKRVGKNFTIKELEEEFNTYLASEYDGTRADERNFFEIRARTLPGSYGTNSR